MKLLSKATLFSILLLLFGNSSYATHIVGGDIRYECLGPNTSTGNMRFKVVMHVYRDYINGQAPFDNPAIIGVYRNNSSTIFTTLQLSNPVVSIVPITLTNPCLFIPSNLGVEEAIYEGVVELPYDANGYWLSYQRCCRNGTINNLSNPSSEGATYTIFLSGLAQQVCNSSPTFNDFPPVLICLNKDLTFDHSATDIDGNTLVYEFCIPFHGGGQQPGTGFNTPAPDPPAPPPYQTIQFGAGFNVNYPMPANPALSIDPATGLLTGFPTAQGQYVVGVCVKEYDAQGNLLGSILRDFQFNVAPCDDRVDAQISADSIDLATDHFYVEACGDSIVTFNNTSTIQSFITGYEWRIDMNNGTFFTSSTFEPTVTFPGNGIYHGWLVANPGASGCTDTALLTISISLDVLADFEMDYESCEIGSVDFTNRTSFTAGTPITSYTWDFGDGNSSGLTNPTHQYAYPSDTGRQVVTLRAEDITGCVSTATKVLEWTPTPIFPLTLENSIACVPVDASSFESIHYPISGYQFEWNFGDGNTSNETIGNHVYINSGVYQRNLQITSPDGCTESFSSEHTALDTPRAKFSFSPEALTSFNSLVKFEDASELASFWEWEFGNGQGHQSSFGGDVEYTYPDTGLQVVQLVVTHQNGCTDTATQILDIVPQFTFFLPNALTPNGDGTNDVYKGKGYTTYIKNFDMSIYSRWGEQIFQTSNPNEAWNGRKNNTGEKCQAGVYVVMVRIEGPRGDQQEIKGFATIVY